MEVYKSINHPGGASRVLIFTQWLVRPLAVCSLPLMVMTLVDVLQGRDILRYLIFGFPAAVAFASAWTSLRMRAAPAEIAISGPFAEVRTVLDVLSGRPPRPWRIVLEVRKSEDGFQVAIGESVFELVDDDWPDASRVVGALRAAGSIPNTPGIPAPAAPTSAGDGE